MLFVDRCITRSKKQTTGDQNVWGVTGVESEDLNRVCTRLSAVSSVTSRHFKTKAGVVWFPVMRLQGQDNWGGIKLQLIYKTQLLNYNDTNHYFYAAHIATCHGYKNGVCPRLKHVFLSHRQY